MFPAYAKVQEDKSRLGRGFLELLGMNMSLVIPITMFVMLAAHDILRALLPNWTDTPQKLSEAVLVVRILAAGSLFRTLDGSSPPLFIGVGKPHLETWKLVCAIGFVGTCIYPLSRIWGLAGASLAMAMGSLATLPVWQRVRAEAHVSWSKIGRSMLPGLALGAAIVLAVLGWNLLLKSQVMPGAEWVESSLRISAQTAHRLLAAGSLVMAAVLSLAMYVGVARFLGKQHQVGPYPQLQRAWHAVRRK